MKKTIGTVGHIDTGKTTLSKEAKEKIKQQLNAPKPLSESDFNTIEEYNAFMEFTKPIPMRKYPEMPMSIRTIGEYLKEYNLIMEKRSQLTATQRILVKNVIHHEVRKGTITLIKG